MKDNALEDLLRFDPLSAAEKITGHDYKEDKSTMGLGFAMHIDHNERLRATLDARDDTAFVTEFAKTRRIFAELGFTEIYSRKTPVSFAHDDGRKTDTLIVLWRAGVLGVIESYGADSTNSSKIYYNWRANDGVRAYDYISSGRVHDGELLVGDHDTRIGLRHRLTEMDAAGTFLSDWVYRPHLWLIGYGESNSDDFESYDKINADTIAQFPPDVIDSITAPRS